MHGFRRSKRGSGGHFVYVRKRGGNPCKGAVEGAFKETKLYPFY
jgi:hypothetical protein